MAKKNKEYMSENVNVHCYIPLWIKLEAKKEDIIFSSALIEGIKLLIAKSITRHLMKTNRSTI